VDQKSDVVDVGALLRAAAEPIRKLEGREANPKLVLERLAQTEVGRQRQCRHQLREADVIVAGLRRHGASLDRAHSSPSAPAFGRITTTPAHPGHAAPSDEEQARNLTVLLFDESGRARASELVAGGTDHRLELPEVGRVDVDLAGDADLVLGRDRLGVIAPQLMASTG
jgi:hypothetical protein